MTLSALGPSAPNQDGFRVSVNGATLADFVQMECLAQSRQAFRITSADKIGYMYFDGGQILHAISGDHVGEAAALDILKWRDGAVEPCNVGWPDQPTIHANWQSLLLTAAQARDESGRHKLVPFPAQRSLVPRPNETKQPTKAEEKEMSAPPSLSFANFAAVVRLDPNGNVLNAKGQAEELAPVVAYSARLSELVGNMLGMEGFVALECLFGDERLLMHRERTGNLVALKARVDQDLSAVRELFGI
ncbi:MAG TPA: DUF4388 domain-containing protein [Polyangiaceae bacterium]|jgi:hypothetical protein